MNQITNKKKQQQQMNNNKKKLREKCQHFINE